MPCRVGGNTSSSHATSRCLPPSPLLTCAIHAIHTTTAHVVLPHAPQSPLSMPGFTMCSAGGPPVAYETGFTILLHQLPSIAWLEARSRSGVVSVDFNEPWLSCSGTTTSVGTAPQRLQKDIAQRIGPLGEMICLLELQSRRKRTRLRKRGREELWPR